LRRAIFCTPLELSAGRWVTHPRPDWGFTKEEAKQIAAW
jgi:hypothetical protein